MLVVLFLFSGPTSYVPYVGYGTILMVRVVAPLSPFPFLGENPLLRAHSFHSSVFGEKRMRKR